MASKQKFTQKQIIDALKETKGMVYLAAERLGCNTVTIYNYRDRYPAVRAVMEAEDGKFNDVAEMKFYQATMAGEPWAVQFRLRLRARDRGYTEHIDSKVELSGQVKIDSDITDDERIARLAAILDAAREKRDRQSDSELEPVEGDSPA